KHQALHSLANQKDYLFEAIPLPKNSNQYYGFSQFTFGLNEFLNNEEKSSAPPTDSRFRPDLKALENADTSRAVEAKANLEKLQRSRNEAAHKRMWFEQRQDPMTNTTLWVCNAILIANQNTMAKMDHTQSINEYKNEKNESKKYISTAN
ncbi:Oxysterol-binding protein-related protein, partial [Dirofilaria immitis]